MKLPNNTFWVSTLHIAVLLAVGLAIATTLAKATETLSTPDTGILIPAFDFEIDGLEVTAHIDDGAYDLQASPALRRELTVSVPPEVKLIEHDVAVLIARANRSVDISYCINPGPTKADNSDLSVFKPYQPIYFLLPRGICAGKPVTFGVTSPNGRPELGAVYFATTAEVKSAYRMRKFFGVDLTIASAGISFLALVIALVSLPLSANVGLYHSFIGLMAVWTTSNTLLVGPFYDANVLSYEMWSELGPIILLLTLSIFLNEWTQKLKVIRLVGISGIVCILSILIISGNALSFSATQFDYLRFILIGVLSLQNLLQLSAKMANSDLIDRLAFTAFSVCIGLTLIDTAAPLIDSLDQYIGGQTGKTLSYIPMAVFPAVSTMLLIVAGQNRSIQNEIVSQNKTLNDRLSKQAEELAEVSKTREVEQAEAAALRERQRIMEDIHDGFGGSLLSLLLQAEAGGLKGETLKHELRSSLQDLRLIVDSMDTAAEDLSLSLGALRGRLETDLQNAGIDLNWSAELSKNTHRLGSKETLSVYRIIQEAATNAINHSNATEFSVSIEVDDESSLSVRILDNGCGFVRKSPSGRGLKNIVGRAQEMGGYADVNGENGCEIRVSIPLL